VGNGGVALIIVGIFVLAAIIAIGVSAMVARGENAGEGRIYLIIVGTFILAEIGALVVGVLVS
jgi:hypothetical protein